jgi:hypothetical protein
MKLLPPNSTSVNSNLDLLSGVAGRRFRTAGRGLESVTHGLPAGSRWGGRCGAHRAEPRLPTPRQRRAAPNAVANRV